MNADFISGQLGDLATKLETAARQLNVNGRSSNFFVPEKKKDESKLAECVRRNARWHTRMPRQHIEIRVPAAFH